MNTAEVKADEYARQRHDGFPPAPYDNILLMETREHFMAGWLACEKAHAHEDRVAKAARVHLDNCTSMHPSARRN